MGLTLPRTKTAIQCQLYSTALSRLKLTLDPLVFDCEGRTRSALSPPLERRELTSARAPCDGAVLALRKSRNVDTHARHRVRAKSRQKSKQQRARTGRRREEGTSPRDGRCGGPLLSIDSFLSLAGEAGAGGRSSGTAQSGAVEQRRALECRRRRFPLRCKRGDEHDLRGREC